MLDFLTTTQITCNETLGYFSYLKMLLQKVKEYMLNQCPLPFKSEKYVNLYFVRLCVKLWYHISLDYPKTQKDSGNPLFVVK